MPFNTTRLGLNLTPASATWAAPFAVYYLFLQNRVVYQRLTSKTYLGDNSDASKSLTDPLYLGTRSQLNFIENVPLALILSTLAELNGGESSYINYALGALFAFRVAHVELGLLADRGLGKGRPVGFYGTQAVLASLAGYTAFVVSNYWTSFKAMTE